MAGSDVMQMEVGREFAGYEIVRHIGGGGMAQIYLARTTGLAGFEKYLALKVINREYANEPRFIQMLINEAKIAVGLSHVNVAQVFDLGECNGIYYIAMEYVDGLDVLELVNGLHAINRHVPVEAVVYIGRQICSGLHYAHSRKDRSGQPLNIVHRDISPQNVLVSRAGEIKLVDFGIAKAAGVRTRTQAGVIKGKVNYMAPEQVLGHKADARTDIFAVGIVLWEMLTSQMVYSGDNVEELAAKVRKAAIAAPSTVRSEVPPELDRIVLHALHPTARERVQSAHDLQVELTKFLSATAPDYSSSDLSRLVEEVVSSRGAPPAAGDIPHLLSHEDRLEDQHSVIFKRQGAAELVLMLADGEQVYPVSSELTLGRAGQVTVPDARVSRQHARVRRVGKEYIIEDLGSSNGTYVDDRRVTGPYMLKDGNRIRLGNCQILFRMVQANEPSPSSDVEHTPAARARSMRLLVASGDAHSEKKISSDVELTYQLDIGPLRLSGNLAQLVKRSDGFWLEPAGSGRASISYNGARAAGAKLLKIGDRFEIDGVHFEVAP
jgi:serine/threonine protein kinase